MNAISVLAYRLVATLAAMVALLVAFSVLATAIPLAMFSYGVQHSHYLTVSFIQYLNPLIQFCVAVLLLHEPMRAQGYAAFMVIWVAIAVYSFGAIRAYWERLKPHAR
ncbi:EamA family transporter [Bifidobacterium longum]|uniref:EamA family transporter n=2 Tax=Bifidobacterium TaxID=1678 RepID=UPI001E583D86|nr:EamA family transporter [Bifidobacterium longum]